MLVAITYGDEKYSMSKKVNVLSAYLLGHARKVKCYSPKDIDSEFFDKHREILMETRGGVLVVETISHLKDIGRNQLWRLLNVFRRRNSVCQKH